MGSRFRFLQACSCFGILSWSHFFATKKMKQLSKFVNCYASLESGKMNNEHTFFSKGKEQSVTDLVVDKAYCSLYTKVAVKMF